MVAQQRSADAGSRSRHVPAFQANCLNGLALYLRTLSALALNVLALNALAGNEIEQADVTPDPVADVVASHVKAIGRIHSYHFVIQASSTAKRGGQVVVPPKTDTITEIWRQGLLRREQERSLRAGANPSKEPAGDMNEWSMDATRVFGLKGWDPEKNHTLPIEFGRSASEFASIQGRIGLRNPDYGTKLFEERTLLFQVVSGASLADLAMVAELKIVPQSNASVTRLSIGGSADKRLKGIVGPVLVDVDHNHGDMISRIEFRHEENEQHALTEAMRFQEAEHGLFIPTHVKRTITMNALKITRVADFEVTTCEVNRDIAAGDLAVHFPEGIKVVETTGDGTGQKLHIWGREGPYKTFGSAPELQDYVFERARNFQSSTSIAGGALDAGRATSGKRWVLVAINVSLLAVSGLLITLRRRFGG